MKFRRCFYCIVFNCFVILPHLSAKPVSLNKLIEAEEKSIQSRQERIKQETEERPKLRYNVPLVSKLSQLTRTVSGSIFSQDKLISPLQYRKTFQIKSPLKPRRVKLFQRSNKLHNPTTKRDTNHHDTLNEKYIPLLRNIGMLFDNMLGPDSGESSYGTGEDYGDEPNESDEVVCKCASKKGNVARTIETRQKTAASSRVIAIEVTARPTEIATTTTYNPANDNVSIIRRNKNIPLLFTGNTTSFRRNNSRFSERSNTTYIRSSERHIAGPCRNNECNTGDGKIEPDTEDDEENSRSVARDDARSDGLDARRRGDGDDSRNSDIIGESVISNKFKTSTDKTVQGFRRHISQHERKDQFKVRGDEAESASVLSKSDSRLRESSEETQLLQTTENYEEDAINGQNSNTVNQQLPERNGKNTTEDQKFCGTDETLTKQLCGTIQTVTIGNKAANESSPLEKILMIFDGYSVVEDVNGKNTLTEKAITIHS